MLKMDRINPLPYKLSLNYNFLKICSSCYWFFRNSIQLGLGGVAMTKESTWLPVTKGLTDLWVKNLKPSAFPCVKYIIIQTQILNYKIIKTILLNIIISTVFQCDTFRESKFSEIFFAQESVNSFISQ